MKHTYKKHFDSVVLYLFFANTQPGASNTFISKAQHLLK